MLSCFDTGSLCCSYKAATATMAGRQGQQHLGGGAHCSAACRQRNSCLLPSRHTFMHARLKHAPCCAGAHRCIIARPRRAAGAAAGSRGSLQGEAGQAAYKRGEAGGFFCRCSAAGAAALCRAAGRGQGPSTKAPTTQRLDLHGLGVEWGVCVSAASAHQEQQCLHQRLQQLQRLLPS